MLQRALQGSILSAVEQVGKKMETFFNETLSVGGSKRFYAHISKSSISTFDNMSVAAQIKEQVKVTISPEVLYRQDLCIAKSR